jgi:hypothetical protein
VNLNSAGFTGINCDNTGNTDQWGICKIENTFTNLSGSYTEIWKVGSAVAAPTLTFSITGSGTPSITAGSLPAGTIGVPYAVSIAVTGGTSPYSWTTFSGSLPPGLSLPIGKIASPGSISGTPSAIGELTFGLQVADNAGNVSATQLFSIKIDAPNKPYITTASLPPGSVGVQYSYQFAAEGGSGGPYTWTSTGTLPPGLTFVGGLLSGFPTASGDTPFSVTAHDSSGAASDPKSLTVSVPVFTEYIRLGGRVLAIEHR